VIGAPTTRRALRAAFAGALAVACASPTEATGSSTLVNGTWSYFATNAAAPTVINGSLSFTARGGSTFGGSLDGTESGEPSGDRRVVGIVSGRVLDSTLVDFDLTLAGDALRHVGTVRGDSLIGTWVEMSSGGVVASGAFRARRVK
jgi:hypothetical protein